MWFIIESAPESSRITSMPAGSAGASVRYEYALIRGDMIGIDPTMSSPSFHCFYFQGVCRIPLIADRSS